MKSASSLSIAIIFLLDKTRKKTEQFDSFMAIPAAGINNNIGPCFFMLCVIELNRDKHVKSILALFETSLLFNTFNFSELSQ